MKRKLLFAERMLHGNGETPFNAVIPIKLRGNFEIESLRCALRKLQGKHPFLNAFVMDDQKSRPWFVVSERIELQIPLRIVTRNTDDDWKTESIREWSTLFDTRSGPLMRLVWVKGEEFSEFIMVIHHCLCDGGSAMAILAELLLLIDDGSIEIGKEEPILRIEDIIPGSILNNRKKIIKAKVIGSVANLFLWLVPVKKRVIERKRDYMIHWKLEKELSDRLIRKCKSEGVTVNTALCVAVLNAFKEVRKENFHNKISLPVDIRRFAPKIKRDNIFAFGLMLVVSADKGLDFFADAKRMQEDIDKKTAKLDPYETIMMMEESHSSLNKFTDFLKYGKSSNDCMFSNLGRVDIPYLYKNFAVETIFSPSVIGPLGNTTTLVTSTYLGQMDFTFIASDGFIPYDEAQAIKEKMMQILNEL
nr:condensation domain-containing protein [Pedobacter panaciterrae]